MSVMYKSTHDAITFHLLEMSSITTPNQKQFGIFAQGTFLKFFKELHNEKISIWKLRVNGIFSITGTRVNVYYILLTR